MTARTKTPKEPRRLYATREALDTMQHVYEQNICRSKVLYALQPDRHSRCIQKNLEHLKSAHLVKRITEDKHDPDVHIATEAGSAWLARYRGLPDVAVNFYRPRGDFRIEYDHKLGISQTIGAIRAGLMKTDARFIPHGEIARQAGITDDQPLKLFVQGGCMIKDSYHTMPHGSYIEPDGIFGLEYPTGKKTFFAVEYQRTGAVNVNTLAGISSMRKKYVGYADIHARNLATYWGIEKLRVLFVFTRKADYLASLKLCAEMFPDGAPMFYHVYQDPYYETEGGYMRASPPNVDLPFTPLERVGCDPDSIYRS